MHDARAVRGRGRYSQQALAWGTLHTAVMEKAGFASDQLKAPIPAPWQTEQSTSNASAPWCTFGLTIPAFGFMLVFVMPQMLRLLG